MVVVQSRLLMLLYELNLHMHVQLNINLKLFDFKSGFTFYFIMSLADFSAFTR